MAEAGQERTHNHNRAAKLGALCHKFLGFNVGGVHFIGLEGIGALCMTGYLYPHVPEELDEVFDIQDFRDVGYCDGVRGKENCADDLQGFVFCALRSDGAGKLVPAFYDEFCHYLLGQINERQCI